ncbi:2-acyl-glycerophospho-ethanolamine acyltransferase [Rossellomorea vietnamensis]|uniref:2-acyl-glycerophospho-ethanolamine acyltransferase n=2 Tax=Rossellomorea TaxID=2837508 RepID=A0A5D4KA61_9BACI|nr:2-acyl-glycerophospho-ethanolamine acyltransferase [Rossellomorea vietnamensis]TYS79947.1 2-acyl-glycerophospho-ethanolamine acyltransferase [Rossellomorea aquimaris]
MKREALKIITEISFYIALMSLAGMLLTILTPLRVLTIVLFLTMVGIPLSILSMFSREHIAKRIFALLGNLLPVSLVIYALVMEFIDEFLRAAP